MNDLNHLLDSPDAASRERMWGAVNRKIQAGPRRAPRRLGVIAVLLAAAAVSVPAVAGATNAGIRANQDTGAAGANFTPEQLAEIEHQQFLLTALDALGELEGYADGALQPESNSIRVQWNGELTEQAKNVIANAKAKGIDTEVVYAEYLPEELGALGGKMLQALRLADFDVWEIGPANDYSSLEVKGTNLTSADQEQVSKIARATIGTVPVKVVPFDPIRDGSPMSF